MAILDLGAMDSMDISSCFCFGKTNYNQTSAGSRGVLVSLSMQGLKDRKQ